MQLTFFLSLRQALNLRPEGSAPTTGARLALAHPLGNQSRDYATLDLHPCAFLHAGKLTSMTLKKISCDQGLSCGLNGLMKQPGGLLISGRPLIVTSKERPAG